MGLLLAGAAPAWLALAAPPPSDTAAQVRLLENRPLRALAACACVLGAVTVNDSLIYLALQRQTGLQPVYFSLLYVATPAVDAVAAGPVRLLADRIGRHWVLAGGPVALALLLVPTLRRLGSHTE